jgi:N6-L-threonylcarbamoyladenine synthase
MITLGIETSCDETALCLLETKGDYPAIEYRVLSHIIHSQAEMHSKYGGVFPMMAKREHAKHLVPLLEQAIKESGIATESFGASSADLENIKKICGDHDEDLYRSILNSSLIKGKPAVDQIAVTAGPGLEPALWVGINFANALSSLWKVPAIGVNHMEGHIVASFLPKTETKYAFEKLIECSFPAIAFLASGGHTEIVLVKGVGNASPQESKYKILGATRDDAIGEAFDKIARMLGLPYPGGPEISRLAEMERKENTATDTGTFLGLRNSRREIAAVSPAGHSSHTPPTQAISARSNSPRPSESSVSSAANASFHIKLPRPMINTDTLDMSFAGLKTAVLYELRKHEKIDELLKKEVAREFEDAVTDVILAKLEKAFDEHSANTLIVGGGVLANKHILEACKSFALRRGIAFLPPAVGLSGDNALMIAMASAINGKNINKVSQEGKIKVEKITAQGNLSL